MKRYFIFFLFIISFHAHTQSLKRLRNLYHESMSNESLAESFYTLTDSLNSLNQYHLQGTIMGYKAMTHFVKSYYAINPFTKYSQFNQGKDLLEEAIFTYPDNTELRYLRLTIQMHVPKFLGYHEEINEDTEFIVKNLNLCSDHLKNKVIAYFKLYNIKHGS